MEPLADNAALQIGSDFFPAQVGHHFPPLILLGISSMTGPHYVGLGKTVKEHPSPQDILEMAYKMYSPEELDQMSPQQRAPIFSLAEANLMEPVPPSPGLLRRQREVLGRSLLHPALTR